MRFFVRRWLRALREWQSVRERTSLTSPWSSGCGASSPIWIGSSSLWWTAVAARWEPSVSCTGAYARGYSTCEHGVDGARRSRCWEADTAVAPESETRVMRDLPRVAIEIAKAAGVAAVEGIGRLSGDRRPVLARLVEY